MKLGGIVPRFNAEWVGGSPLTDLGVPSLDPSSTDDPYHANGTRLVLLERLLSADDALFVP